jgi:TonB family protein
MKNLIIKSTALVFICLTTFADDGTKNNSWYYKQDIHGNGSAPELYYEVHAGASRSVIKEKLNEARYFRDFIPGYPVNWIDEYVSAEIMATCNGKVMKAVSVNDVLNSEQKNILHSADLATTIDIKIKYKYKNSANDNAEIGTINISATVVNELPEIEAEYIGGYPQLSKYLKENAIDKITETTLTHFQQGAVLFIINEEGEIVNAKISRSSGDSKTDNLLIEVIKKMPKWKPAKNSKGIKVKQVFEFSIGNFGC